MYMSPKAIKNEGEEMVAWIYGHLAVLYCSEQPLSS